MLWFKKKKKKGPPGHQTNFQKSIDQNQSFFIPGLTFELKCNSDCYSCSGNI